MSYHDVPPFVISPLIFTSIMFAFIQGKGYSPRDTESGQLLIDRAMHLDVLEYLLWINRWLDQHRQVSVFPYLSSHSHGYGLLVHHI